jgi:nucleoside-diphosphate-sugar epimerase
MKVLLTGASGFLGTRIHRSLVEAGCDVIALARTEQRAESKVPRTLSVTCDLNDPQHVSGVVDEHRPEAVVHVAWYTKHGAYWTAPENLDCVGASVALLRASARSGCRRFVGVGTCAEYDWNHAHHVERSTPCAPRSLYGTCKLAVCDIGERFAAATEMSFAWARCNFLFGFDEPATRLCGAAIDTLARGQDLDCSSGQQQRDFLEVGEAASAITALLRSDVTGPVNIGSGEPMSVKQLVQSIETIVGGAGRARFGARPPRDDDPAVLLPALSRLHDEVHWRPGRTVAQCLETTVAERLARSAK